MSSVLRPFRWCFGETTRKRRTRQNLVSLCGAQPIGGAKFSIMSAKIGNGLLGNKTSTTCSKGEWRGVSEAAVYCESSYSKFNHQS